MIGGRPKPCVRRDPSRGSFLAGGRFSFKSLGTGTKQLVVSTQSGIRVGCAALIAALLLVGVGPARAYDFERRLNRGDKGRDVRALQVRMAGWFPADGKEHFALDGTFGSQTAAAVRAFESFYRLPNPNGVADGRTYAKLNALQDADGSTEHFNFSEFDQNRNAACSARANAYAGTFRGGMVASWKVRRNVRRLMWRLEAVRAKGGHHPIGINSGFRSVPYNDCIGGASASQHMYGTAADNRMAEVSNRRERGIAKNSQVHGIGCYSSQTHNHFDIRIDNPDLASARFWWWPDRDRYGRDLDENGSPCWGEVRQSAPVIAGLSAVASAMPGAGSFVPSVSEVERFGRAGEPEDLAGTD
jgi:zinc D-Ala-D-Ala carboxypeptidase